MKDPYVEEILDKLKAKILKDGIVDLASIVKISPGHLYHLVHHRTVYRMTKKMCKRIEDSGILL